MRKRAVAKALQAAWPPNLLHVVRRADVAHLAYERRFLARYPLRRREWGIVFPYGMGDLYVACAFAEHVRASGKGDGFAVFVNPQFAYIPTLFKAVSRIVPVQGFDLKRLHQYHVFEPGRLFTAFPLHGFLKVIGYKGITFLDYFCLFLNLPLGTVPVAPRPQTPGELEAGRRLLADQGLRPGRTVLLAPKAGSTAEAPATFWAQVARALKARGYDVATNVAGREVPVPGTKALNVPIASVIAVAQEAGRVVSARSGLCDLLAHASCRLTVVYPDDAINPHPMLTRGFGMVSSGWRSDASEVWYDAKDPAASVAAALAGA